MNDGRLDLHHSRNLGDIISNSFSFLNPRLRTFAAVVGPAVLLGVILQLVIFALMPDIDQQAIDGMTDDELRQYVNDLLRDVIPLLAALVLFVPLIWIFNQLVTAAVVVVVKAIGEGKDILAGDALDAAQDRVKDLLLASLRSGIIIALFSVSIIGIPWAIKRGVQWSLIPQSIMADGVNHRDALQHSADLVEGDWWLTFGRLLVIGLLVGVANWMFSSAIQAGIPDVPGILIASLIGFLTIPYGTIATTLVFYDYKHRKSPPAKPAPEPLLP